MWASLRPTLPLTSQVCCDLRRAGRAALHLLCPRLGGASACRPPLQNTPDTLCASTTAPLQQEQPHQQHQGVHAALEPVGVPFACGRGSGHTRSSITELQVLTSPVQNRRPPCGPSTGGVGGSKPRRGACRGGSLQAGPNLAPCRRQPSRAVPRRPPQTPDGAAADVRSDGIVARAP